MNKDSYYSKNKEARKAYYDKNKEARTAYQRKYREANREKDLERKRKYHREKGRPTRLQRLYGLTEDVWEDIFNRQGRCCAICATKEPRYKQPGWHVDHCHKTGAVRGILCFTCNLTLGRLGDTRESVYNWMNKALTYLK